MIVKHEATKARRRTQGRTESIPRLAMTHWSPCHLGTMSRVVVAGLVVVLALFVPALAAGIDQAKPGESGAVMDPHAGFEGVTGESTGGGMGGITTAQALAAEYARQDRTGFERDIQMEPFGRLAVMHLDQLKIIDSWARQNVYRIRHRQSIDGKNAVLVALDMAFRPEAWLKKNIVYVEHVPIREELGALAGNAVEARRIREEALVSPAFLFSKPALQRLEELSRDSRQVRAVNQVIGALEAFANLRQSLAMVPPTAELRERPWVFPMDIFAADVKKQAATSAPAGAAEDLPPYTNEQKLHITRGFHNLELGWQANDVKTANEGLAELGAVVPTIDPTAYPSAARRTVELWYNRAYSGTLVAFVYFTAMVLFFLVAVGVVEKTSGVRKTALVIFASALACHIAAMGVRWWISGRIPIQNQFESVMGSACLGCCIGLALETWKKNGIFGTAFALVGFLAATVLLAAPYVFGMDLGAAPAKVAGILSTGWLYIHVNIVIASYALIFASAVVAAVYLATRLVYWINPIEPGFEEGGIGVLAEGAGGSDATPSVEGGSRGTGIGPMVGGSKSASVAVHEQYPHVTLEKRRSSYLETLDQANMVILQMAFWMLGVGILCGAVWADQSWGRPWGWDPKETFALVTWMVYLVIVHVRLVIKFKTDATAVLSLAGCGIMLFNWIGVNFFLKGLHSYA
jgi:cytochrome c-type biogenesis protein CcsB